MSELECKSVLKKLLRAGISYEGDGLSRYLDSQVDAPTWQSALLWDPKLRGKYWEAMLSLQKELVPQHVIFQDLYNKLWKLFRDVTLKRTELQSRTKLEQKINDFASEVKKPLIDYCVIYEIKNLDIGERNFTLGNVEVLKLTEDNL